MLLGQLAPWALKQGAAAVLGQIPGGGAIFAAGQALYGLLSGDPPGPPPLDLRPLLSLDVSLGPPAYWIALDGDPAPSYTVDKVTYGGKSAPASSTPCVVVLSWAVAGFAWYLRSNLMQIAGVGQGLDDAALNAALDEAVAAVLSRAKPDARGNLWFRYGSAFPALPFSGPTYPSTHAARYLGRRSDGVIALCEWAHALAKYFGLTPNPTGFDAPSADAAAGFIASLFSQPPVHADHAAAPSSSVAAIALEPWMTAYIAAPGVKPVGAIFPNTAWNADNWHVMGQAVVTGLPLDWNTAANAPLRDVPLVRESYGDHNVHTLFSLDDSRAIGALSPRNPWRIVYPDAAQLVYALAKHGLGNAGLSPSCLLTGPTLWGDLSLLALSWDKLSNTTDRAMWAALVQTQLALFKPFKRFAADASAAVAWGQAQSETSGAVPKGIPTPSGASYGMLDKWTESNVVTAVRRHAELAAWALSPDGTAANLPQGWTYPEAPAQEQGQALAFVAGFLAAKAQSSALPAAVLFALQSAQTPDPVAPALSVALAASGNAAPSPDPSTSTGDTPAADPAVSTGLILGGLALAALAIAATRKGP